MKKLFFFLFIFCLFSTANLFSQGTWVSKASYGGTYRQGHVGFSIGVKGYFAAGSNSAGILQNDLWEWDSLTNVWTQKASFGTPDGRNGGVGFAIGNKGYVGTGYNFTDGFMNDFWEWNQATNTWVQKANFGGTGRDYAVGFSIGNKGYIGTGN
jgi:hypothetical protein